MNKYIIFHSVQVVISHNPSAISLKWLLHSDTGRQIR